MATDDDNSPRVGFWEKQKGRMRGRAKRTERMTDALPGI